jgi:hypothetical protein
MATGRCWCVHAIMHVLDSNADSPMYKLLLLLLAVIIAACCCLNLMGCRCCRAQSGSCSSCMTSCGQFAGCCRDVLASVPQCVLLSEHLGSGCWCAAKCAASSPPHKLCGLQHGSRCSVLWLFIIMFWALQWLVPWVCLWYRLLPCQAR